ncbi:hypothetical protein ACHWQZ_G017682 [Mnemiopsis leidyi]
MQREKQVWVPSSVPLESSTTVRDHYIRHSHVPTKSKRPEMSLHRNPGKMSELTSHRADYTLKQVDKVVPAGDYSSLTCVPGPFDSTTTQKSDYVEYQARPRTSFTPHREYKNPTVPMDGLTNHKVDYTAWELPKKTARKPVQFVSTSGKTGTTTFQNDFTGRQARRPSPCLPQQGNMERGQFYGSTTFRDNFVAWPVCPPKQRVPSAHVPPEGPLESKTCYRDDFGAKTARPVSCKPRLEYRRPSGAMATSTTHRDTFQEWKVKPSSPAQDYHVRSTPPPFQGLSTYKDHYNECIGLPAGLLAPPNTYIKSEKPLDTVTTYSRDFKKKERSVCPVPRLPKTPDLLKSGHKFYTSSVNDKLSTRVAQPVLA